MSALPWIALTGAAVAALTVDAVWARRTRTSDVRAALLATAALTIVGVAFAGVVAACFGSAEAGRYITVFSLERVLSVDNVAVFAAVFTAFAVPASRQGRVLTAGLLGALALRVGFVTVGLALVATAHLLLVVFGLILIATGVAMMRPQRDTGSQEKPAAWLRWAPVSIRQRPELMALVAIIVADVAFAVDSILAAFAVTTHAYPIIAANVFAVLGLRPMYVVLTHALGRFRLLRPAMGVLLGLIGVELVVEPFVAIPAWATLAVVVGVVGTAMAVSWAQDADVRPGRLIRRAAVTVGGGVLVAAGAVMLVLPGPGLLVIAAGLTLLATEYAWARGLLDAIRARLHRVSARLHRVRERVGR